MVYPDRIRVFQRLLRSATANDLDLVDEF
jgi:hypothetical protein